MNEMTFSIIIPVYNVAPYLRECLDSVLAQTYTDWEAICVDDGSTDGSGAILDEYAAKDERFKVIHQTNAGVSAARNAALDVAQGEFVWFVDGDDAIHPESLMWLKTVFEQNPSYNAFGFNEGNLCGENVARVWPRLPPVSDVSKIDVANSLSILVHRRGVCGTIVRRSLIGDDRFAPYSLGEDVLFHMTVFWKDVKTLYLDVPIYFYRQRSDSLTHAPGGYQKISDFLETEYAMLSLMDAHRDLWSSSSVGEYFSKIRDMVYLTYGGGFWALPLEQISKLSARWAALQKLYQSLDKDVSRYRRFHAWVASVIPSAWLCRFLYRLPVRVHQNPFEMLCRKLFPKRQMRLGITYNLYDGEELIKGSILSVRSVVSYVNVVYQDVSNAGVRRVDSVRPYLEKLKDEGLIDEIISYDPDLTKGRSWNEKRKRVIGMEACRRNKCTHFMMMDVDEFYRAKEIERAAQFMKDNGIDYAAVSIVEYLRNPAWMLVSNYMFPPDQENYVFYVPFITKMPSRIDVRKFPCLVDPTRQFATGKAFYLFPKHEIAMHHMAHVRKDLDGKYRNSTAGRVTEYLNGAQAVLSYQFKDGSIAPNGYDFIGQYLVKRVPDEFNIGDVEVDFESHALE